MTVELRVGLKSALERAALKAPPELRGSDVEASSADVGTLETAIETPNSSEITKATIERNQTQRQVLDLVQQFQDGNLNPKHAVSAARLKNALIKTDQQGALTGLDPKTLKVIADLRAEATATVPNRK